MKEKIFYFLITPSKKQLTFFVIIYFIAVSLLIYGDSDDFSEGFYQRFFKENYFTLTLGIVLIGKAFFEYWKAHKQSS